MLTAVNGWFSTFTILIPSSFKFLTEYQVQNSKQKGIEFLPQTQIFLHLYLCNSDILTLDILNLDFFI